MNELACQECGNTEDIQVWHIRLGGFDIFYNLCRDCRTAISDAYLCGQLERLLSDDQ